MSAPFFKALSDDHSTILSLIRTLNHYVANVESGEYVGTPAVTAAITAMTGMVAPFAGSAAPAGWLLCNGAAVSRTAYAALFAVTGTAFGAGDGSTTFNVPNLKGRVPVGINSADSAFNTRGKTGGEAAHTLAANEIADHWHYVLEGSLAVGVYGGVTTSVGLTKQGTGRSTTFTTGSPATGHGSAHNNLQPYVALHFIIKT